MSQIRKITTPEDLLLAIDMVHLRHKLLKYQELLGEIRFILKERIKPSLPNISSFLIDKAFPNIDDKTGLVFLTKKFNLNNNDIPHMLALKTDIKSFLFTARQLIDQQLLILGSLGEIAQIEGGKDHYSKELQNFISSLHSEKYSHLNPALKNYFLSHTYELVYLRFVRNSVKTIGDLKAEMMYTTDSTEINIIVKPDYLKNDKLLLYLNPEKKNMDIFCFKLIEFFTKTLDLFALYNNLIMDLLVERAKDIDPNFDINLSVSD